MYPCNLVKHIVFIHRNDDVPFQREGARDICPPELERSLRGSGRPGHLSASCGVFSVPLDRVSVTAPAINTCLSLRNHDTYVMMISFFCVFSLMLRMSVSLT